MAKISVIVPVYKVEQYLRRCVDSILSQTFSDFELILIDDGSPDRCGEICDEYKQRDGRVVVIHQSNGGLSAARNTGIIWSLENSDSDWLTFVDSDDWVHSEYLERLFRAVNKYGTKISVCGFQETTGEMNTNIIDISELNVSPEEFYDQRRINAIVAWGKLYWKKCFEEIRYPKGKLHEDEFITYKVLFEFPYITILKAKLYYYFRNDQSIIHTWSYKRLDALDAYKEQMNFFELNGFNQAYIRSVRAYVGGICDNCLAIDGIAVYNKQRKKLKKELRLALKEYNQQIPFNECRWAYAVAFPKFIRCYNFVERIIKYIWKKLCFYK